MLKPLASSSAPLAGIWSKFGLPSATFKRLRSLFWACLISAGLLLGYMLDPIDQFFWINQSKLSSHSVSNEFVFIGTDHNYANRNDGRYRSDLANVLYELDRMGAKKIYIDLAFSEPSTTQNDSDLRTALNALGDRVILVDQISGPLYKPGKFTRTIDEIGGETQRVISRKWANYLGYVWTREQRHEVDGKVMQSLAASLAGEVKVAPDPFNIDYSFPSQSIPAISIGDVSRSNYGQLKRVVAGKTIVIGAQSSQTNSSQKIPGDYAAPYSYISIYAAETLKSGRTGFVGAWPFLISTLLTLLIITSIARHAILRRFLYIALLLSFPTGLYIGSVIGTRMEISYALTLAIIYLVMRSRAHWRARIAHFDLDTGLPTMKALEDVLTRLRSPDGYIVVARIHGYENVLKTLEKRERTQYVMRLVDRVRAADSDLAIYFEGHNFAWQAAEYDPEALVEHLEGLRAIFAAPIVVADRSVDVGISFGVARLDCSGDARLAAALAAAEDSSEAENPICFAPDTSRSDELWDISLRARIDEAMKAGEIYCVYQPKIDIRDGRLKGVEALVRWQDPERGFISPMKFIAQCEKAGRMEHLTRYVLQSACNSGRLLHFRGQDITMSVNISATLLSNMRIVSLVSNVLQTTGFPAESLILEITETSRIGDHATAAAVLGELKALGAALSIDDFGVGAANFETLYQLPFDELKIDRLFVANLVNSVKAKAICASVVAMGREAQVAVVAEGVEDIKTLELLEKIGCYTVQGFALSRPMSISNLLNLKDLWINCESRA